MNKVFWTTPGFENQKAFLANSLLNGRLSHAYLFSGSCGKAKTDFALEFGQKILELGNGESSASKKESGVNSDLILIDGAMNIEAARGLLRELSLKPFSHQKKIAIIENFEKATEEAASSILKTLEEPTETTILILLVENKKALLPTIVSRTQEIYFGGLGQKVGHSTVNPQSTNTDSKIENFAQIKSKNPAERLIEIKSYSEMESEDLDKVFEFWLNDSQATLSKKPENYLDLRLLMSALDGIRRNLNKKLILQKLFLNLKT